MKRLLLISSAVLGGCISEVEIDIDADQDGLLGSQEEEIFGFSTGNEMGNVDGFWNCQQVDIILLSLLGHAQRDARKSG